LSIPLTTDNAEVFGGGGGDPGGTITDGKVWLKTVDPDPQDIANPDNVAPVDATLA